MSDLPKCRICKCNYVSRPFANDYVFACSNNGCFMSAHEFTYAEWAALMGRGEPVGEVMPALSVDWSDKSKTKGVALVDKRLKPGTKLYTQAPAVDGAVLRDATRLDWIACQADFALGLDTEPPGMYGHWVCGDDDKRYYGKDLRDAIDSAIKGEG